VAKFEHTTIIRYLRLTTLATVWNLCAVISLKEKSYIIGPVQALLHASVACNRKLVVDWVPAGDLEDDTFKEVIIDLSTFAIYVS
jgi:hypothetical protein